MIFLSLFAKEAVNFEKLENLHIHNNSIHDSFKNLEHFQNLKILSLRNNRLNTYGVVNLVKRF